ncbi:MAG: FecR family protein [Methylococcaceae bacterium]|jgi:transmembrane sensor
MLNSKHNTSAKDQAIAWIIKLQSASCTQKDRQLFADWLQQHPTHQHLFNAYNSRWQSLDRLKGQDFETRRAALQYRPHPHPAIKPWLGWSAAAIVLLALGLTAFTDNGWYGRDVHYSVALGQHESITLSDGSVMEINSDTDLNVHLSRWQRSVEISHGEVFFRVSHQPERRFVVTAANGNMIDIGTEFDVYLQDDSVLVAVQQGEVTVTTQANNSATLKQNQVVRYNRSGQLFTRNEDSIENLTAWRQGKLIFQDKRLDQVLAELSRYHKQQVRLANPALGKLVVSGSFRIADIDSALDVIASTLAISIQRPNANTVILNNSH